jgi:hypothetical protein
MLGEKYDQVELMDKELKESQERIAIFDEI